MVDETCIQTLCHIFTSIGITDIKLEMYVGQNTSFATFVRTDFLLPYPRISFFGIDDDRYAESVRLYRAAGEENSRFSIESLNAFLSVANCNRNVVERRSRDFTTTVALYENCIIYSCDRSSIRIMEMIRRKKNCVAYCWTDDGDKVSEEVKKVKKNAVEFFKLHTCYVLFRSIFFF
jgi:hypothetical protein